MITKRSPRLDSVKEEDKRVVYDYWTKEVSCPTGSKKDTVKKRVGKGKYVVHPKHVLEKTQSECFAEFQRLYPEIKIKLRKFEQLKPYFLKSARERDRQSCLCRKHVECKMVFDSCMKFRKSNEEERDSEGTTFASSTDAVNSTLCPKDDTSAYHNLACLRQECSECGKDKFKISEKEKSETVVT